MRRNEIIVPDNFKSVEGKLKIVNDSLDDLMEATERMAVSEDESDTADAIVELLADISAGLIVLHMVVEGMLKDQLGCT